MKRITFLFLFLLALVTESYGQVTIGESTATSQFVPFNPFYGFSYGQSIYLASEINANGSITSIQWYYAGSGAMPNSQGITIYLGQTTKTDFLSTTDFVALSDLTAVYTGGLVTGSAAGWKTITLTTPFPYDGIANLVVATDENGAGYDSSSDTFRVSTVGTNRSIYSYSDSINTDPANPGTGATIRGMVQFVPNIIIGGITQACPSPSNIAATLATTTEATIGWSGFAGQTEWEVLVLTQGSPLPTENTAGTLVTGTPTFVATGLTQNTGYSAFVRAKCSAELFSAWTSPTNFRTLCDSFGDFVESFNSTTPGTGVVPNCWAKTIVSPNVNANVSVVGNTAASAPNAIIMSNSSDATATLLLVTPTLSAIGADTHRIGFKARGSGTGFPLIVGTMSDASDASTFAALQTFTLTNVYATYGLVLNTSVTANRLAFRHGLGGTFRNIYIDDVVWEPVPTTVPECVAAVTVAPNACGNFPTTFSWNGVSGADGYNVSVSASANGVDPILDNLNIGNVLTAAFTGLVSTQYYYTITPYNSFGPSVGCVEGTFTTTDTGCYCTSAPTSVDNSGITSITLAGITMPVTAPAVPATPPNFYRSLTGLAATDITQGVSANMSITLQTGYSYATNIWIDFNDNFVFEASELVFSGPEGSNVNPTIESTTFLTPLTAALGQHRMRLVSTDVLQNPANACYSGSYGMTIDLIVNVLPAPACLPPSAPTASNITATSAVLNWVSDGTLFNVEYVFANENQGNGVLEEGITTNTTTLTGLDSQANYAYYLQTDCGNGSLSAWAGPFLFRTGCPSTGDFTENFTTEVNITAPECWYTLVNSTVSTPSVSISSFNDFVNMSTSGNAAAVLYLITPSLTDLPLDTHRIKFKARGPIGTSITVGTMSDPGTESTFAAVQTIQLTTTLADYAVAFLNATTDAHVAIRFAGTANFQTVVVDDVVWETAPDCPSITIVSVTESTATTAAVSWAPGGAETAWQYAYALASVEDPSGLTPVDVTPNPNATIADLQSSSSYKIWVRATCTSGFGEWSAAKLFTTACAPISAFPWTEGFENMTVGNAFPICWFEENGDYTTAVASTWNTPRSGTNYLRNAWAASNEFMWTPGFELEAGVSYDFSFYMQGDGFTGWTVDVFQNTNQNSTGATQLGGTTTASGTGAYVIQPYAQVANTFIPTTAGTYYFAIRVNQPSGSPWYIAFDDFRMQPTPTCVAPAPPTAADVTVNTATMNWIAATPAPANGYEFYISNTAIAPNATTVPTGSVAAAVTTTNLTELTSSTIYRMYVRSICGTSDFSSWSDTGQFTTPCAIFDAPFQQNFDAFLPLCWARAAAGTVETGPTGSAAGIWLADGFLNVGTTGATSANLYFTNQVGWLIAPPMSTTVGGSYAFSFNYGVTAWQGTTQIAMGSDDFVKVVMSADNGVTWTEVHVFNAASNVTNLSQTHLYEFTATTSQVKFAFVASDGTVDDAEDYDFFVDNVTFETNLSNDGYIKNSFTAYPNPVKDVLNLSFDQNISDVAVYNLLGQQMLLMNINANKGQIDMSNLASGTYLVRVNSENAVKTIKVIKQ
jgi:hypothetical protein